jgi:hypothetical protein
MDSKMSFRNQLARALASIKAVIAKTGKMTAKIEPYKVGSKGSSPKSKTN